MFVKFLIVCLVFVTFFPLDYNFRKDDLMPTLASFLDDPTLDFANTRLVTLAPGLRPKRRFAPLAREQCTTSVYLKMPCFVQNNRVLSLLTVTQGQNKSWLISDATYVRREFRHLYELVLRITYVRHAGTYKWFASQFFHSFACSRLLSQPTEQDLLVIQQIR